MEDFDFGASFLRIFSLLEIQLFTFREPRLHNARFELPSDRLSLRSTGKNFTKGFSHMVPSTIRIMST